MKISSAVCIYKQLEIDFKSSDAYTHKHAAQVQPQKQKETENTI